MATQKPTKKRPKVPSLRHCNGRGFVELSGRRIYLGALGRPGDGGGLAREARRVVREWAEASSPGESSDGRGNYCGLCRVTASG